MMINNLIVVQELDFEVLYQRLGVMKVRSWEQPQRAREWECGRMNGRWCLKQIWTRPLTHRWVGCHSVLSKLIERLQHLHNHGFGFLLGCDCQHITTVVVKILNPQLPNACIILVLDLLRSRSASHYHSTCTAVVELVIQHHSLPI